MAGRAASKWNCLIEMPQAYKNQLDRLSEILLALPPSGKDGFEGVFAEALSRISGVPFRLAKSGTQFGNRRSRSARGRRDMF